MTRNNMITQFIKKAFNGLSFIRNLTLNIIFNRNIKLNCFRYSLKFIYVQKRYTKFHFKIGIDFNNTE